METEQAERETYDLIARAGARFPSGFPGLDALGFVPATDADRRAIVLACLCAVARREGHIMERVEGRLVAMHLYGVIDADSMLR